MTVTTTISDVSYVLNGTTLAFAVPFRFLRQEHVSARVRNAAGVETLLLANADYTLTGGGESNGGTLTLATAGTSGDLLFIERNTPRTQEVAFQSDVAFSAQVLEQMNDADVLRSQEDQRTLSRGVQAPRGETALTLPLAAQRAGKFLAFDASGAPVAATGGTGDSGLRSDLAASSGSALISFLASGAGSTPRSLQGRLRETLTVADFSSPQAAIDAAPSGAELWFPPANYILEEELVLKRPIHLRATLGGAQLSMATQNSNHIRIGDGTGATRNALLNCTIQGLTFAPAQGVAAFSSGACIRVEYGAFIHVRDCDFFGADTIGHKLWNAIELDRCEDSWISDSRIRRLLNNGVRTYGASGIANRTVDVIMNRLRTSDIAGDHFYIGPHSQGIFINDPVCIGVAANKSGIHIDADPATEQGTNFFITNPNIEGGNNANSNGIYVSKGQAADILGGWIGGFTPASANGIWFDTDASSCVATSTRIEGGGGVRIDGPACSLNGCEVSGEVGTTVSLIKISGTAHGFAIVGGRVRIATTAGIAITGTPADGVISGVTFASITGDAYITGAAYTNGPAVSGLRGQASKFAAAAATVNVAYGVPVYQITGGTTINNFSLQAPGAELNVQAGAGGITVSNAGNLVLKGGASSLTIAAFTVRKFITDATNWFEV